MSDTAVRDASVYFPLAVTTYQRRRLRRLLRDAERYVPFYTSRFATSGLDVRNDDVLLDLQRLPILTRSELVTTPQTEMTDIRFDSETLFAESTSGSTGEPTRVLVERNARLRRNLVFLKALLAIGYRPWQTLMLLTDRRCKPVSRRLHWTYCSTNQDTLAIAETYQLCKPDVLYGYMTPLRLLAEQLDRSGGAVHKPWRIVTTAEMLDSATSELLKRVFGCPLADFYGATEMGLVAWRLLDSRYYQINNGSLLAEFLPCSGIPNAYRLILTNLDSRAMPIIRYDTGDVVIATPSPTGLRIGSIEGRQIDTIVCADGNKLSPYRITDQFRKLTGLRKFKIVQRAISEFDVDIEAERQDTQSLSDEVQRVFQTVIGADIEVNLRIVAQVIPGGARKFRAVESRVTGI